MLKERVREPEAGVRPYRETFYEPGYQPDDSELLCAYRITPRPDTSMAEAAAAVAAESSVGTWTTITTVEQARFEETKARVYDIQNDITLIAYPASLFEAGSLPNILSSVVGNVFGMKAVTDLRLEDMRIPRSLAETFPGPAYGIARERERLGIHDRAMTGSTIKPKLGLSPKEHAQVVYDTLRGGIDTVKDDENLGDQTFNPFDERIPRTLEMLRKAEAETGETKGYWANVTAPDTEEMLRRMEVVKENGGIYIMIDFLTCGFTALASLRQHAEELGLMIHGHRAFHSLFTRRPDHGVDFRVVAKWARLAGLDHVHVGTGVGKLEGSRQEMQERCAILRQQHATPIGGMIFEQDWGSLKTTAPVASGGLHPGHATALHRIFGNETFFLFGGGTHGHPGGSYAGAQAVRAAVEAAAAGIPLHAAARTNRALQEALDLWSTVTF